jgi:hypothetical protein
MLRTLVWAALLAAFATGFRPGPARADCVRSGTSVTCTGADINGVAVTDNFTIAVDVGAFVQSIYDGEVPSACSEFVAAIRAGNATRIVNRGLVLGRGNCGLGIEAGNALDLTNEGTISTDQDNAFAVVAGNGAIIQNSGTINTVGLESSVVVLGDNARLTVTAAGRMGSTGPFTTTVIAGTAAIISNDGRMGTAGPGGTIVDVGARSTVTNTGTMTVAGPGAIGVRLRGDDSSLTNRGTLIAQPNVPLATGDTSIAVQIDGRGATITNDGTITGQTAGIVVAGSATIVNRGTIRAVSGAAVRADGSGSFTLNNSGQIAGQLTINSASRLSGTGSITSHVQNSGVVAPGGAGIGTLTVGGSYIQAGGRLDIDVNGDGTSDRLVIGGPALSLGGTVAVNFVGAPVRNGQSFTFLTSSGGVLAITRIIPAVVDTSPVFLTPQVVFGANQVSLSVARVPYVSVAATEAQAAVARALDAAVATATADSALLFQTLDLGDAAAARATFEQLAPETLGSVLVPQMGALKALINSASAAMESGPRSKAGWRAWGAAARSGSSRTRAVATRFSADSTVMSAGLDYAFEDEAAFGLMLGRGWTDTKRGRGGADGLQDDDTLIAGVTASGTLGPLSLQGGLGLGDGEMDLERTHSIGGAATTVAGEADTGATFGFVHATRRYDLGGATIQPTFGFDYLRAKVEAFAETGPFGLAVDGHSHDSARSLARLSAETALGQIRPRASVGWRHEFAGLAPTATARIAAGAIGPFPLTGLAGKRDVIEADAEVALDLAPGAVFSVGFGGSLNDRLEGQAVRAGVSVAW